MLTDQPGDLDDYRYALSEINLRVFSGRRLAFVCHALWLALTQKVNLVLIGHVNYAPLGLLMRFLQPSLRYGVMVHGVDVWSRLSGIRRRALQKADFITSVSDHTTNRAVKVNRIDHRLVYLLPNALEWRAGKDDEQGPSDIVANTKRLLTVCRFSKEERYKGVDTVIEALPEIIRLVPSLHYYIVGTGEDLQRHKDLAKSLGVAERTHFLGAVDGKTLRTYYQHCDVFVMPSAGEGFGIVFLEAMSYSKPVVAADSGAVSEVVLDGTTGVLVNYGDKKQLASVISRLCRQPSECERLGRAGYQRLEDNFTFRHFKQTLSEILVEELSQKASINAAAPSSQGAP